MIQEGVDAGLWVFFQNCHLAPSFMPKMERLLENIPPDTVHRDFRIWLTSTPSPSFPVSILQNGSKMTIEPPRGVKANMLRAYQSQITDLLEYFHSDEPKVPTFKVSTVLLTRLIRGLHRLVKGDVFLHFFKMTFLCDD